jgi:energy-converting hydrogenase Eha subunit C
LAEAVAALTALTISATSEVTALAAALLSLALEEALMVERVDSGFEVSIRSVSGMFYLRMLATGAAMAALSVVIMLVASVWRFSMERSVSGVGVGAEMTPVKTLASARMRVNFMLWLLD